MRKKLTVLVVASVAVTALAGCGDSEDNGEHEMRSATNGDEFNDADVDFATDMIQHHAQALQMVDLTMGRNLDPAMSQLSEAIRMAQAPEIELMTDWLTAWEQPIPETVRDHANAHGDGDMTMDPDMPGMMSTEQMAELEAAKGDAFQQMWLEMMIEHHEGAIEMANAQQSDGTFAPAAELADSIEVSQQEEIDTMERLLGS